MATSGGVELVAAGSPADGWHAIPAEECLARLGSAPTGLSQEEAARRLASHGPNELAPAERVAALSILANQLRNVLIVVLLVAVGLSAWLGHDLEAIAIAAIVILAVALGFAQEYRAENALEALRRLSAPMATVLRGGKEARIPAREVVPGDVLLLRTGDRIPCDARVLDAVNLQMEEATLTGESTPVTKRTETLHPGPIPVADRSDLVFAGTAVTYGRGRAVVVATGTDTEFGKIERLLETVEPGPTPLQVNLDRMGTVLARAVLVVVALIVGLGLLRGQPFVEMLVFGIALAVAVVPEALPAVVTISLALGAQRLARGNALVRRLAAAETLGSTSVICSDKTGTLTRDEMTVRALYAGGRRYAVTGSGYEPRGELLLDGAQVPAPAVVLEVLRAGALASDAHVERTARGWEIHGDPTEGALVVAAAKAGMVKADLDARFPRVGEIPFTADRKRMTTLHRVDGGTLACAKGAPEVLLPACTRIHGWEGERRCTGADRAGLLDVSASMAGEALRVVAVARKHGASLGDSEERLTFLGLVGMIDPPRPEVRPALERCREAGVKVVMITGDHPTTARAIAAELGLGRGGEQLTGADLDGLTDDALERRAPGVDVYARTSPAHKLRIVTALQKHGHVVAMTGDGVNDAPALKKADIGIAMGVTGTDVTKEAAVMTLTDDNFASIVRAVECGRGIYGNIKKYLMYLLSSNIGEIGLMAGATLLGLPLPLSAVQILYVNLATDGLPALALAVDPPDDDLMQRPPRDPRRGIFTAPVVTLMAVGGAWSTLLNLAVYAWAMGSGRSAAETMTMTFVSLVLVQFVKAYEFRSEWRSALHRPFANRWLDLAIAWELALLGAVLYVPALQRLFGTYALSFVDGVVVCCAAVTVAPVLEITKVMLRRGGREGPTPRLVDERS